MEVLMGMTQVVLRLARNPGFPIDDDSQGYIINAPLDRDGKLSLAAWHKVRDQCQVIRFKPGFEQDADGRLTHRGSNWYFHYDEASEGDDEPVHRLGDHSLALGSYVTIHESDGRDLTYRVAEHIPIASHPGVHPSRPRKEV
jgi:hypothetical protein